MGDVTDLPRSPPLTPPDCDLRDFPRMALDVGRLFGSEFNALASQSPLAWMIGHKLWYRAWHQVPAASLPNDDHQLCHLAELGFDRKTWAKAKPLALRGWVLADDGRLYHPTVAEMALAAWDKKLEQRWKTECARIKKHNQRLADDQKKSLREGECPLSVPTLEGFLSARTEAVRPAAVPGDVPKDNDNCPPGQRLQEKGKGRGRVVIGLGTDVPKRSGRARTRSAEPTEAEEAAFEAFWAAYPLKKGKDPARTSFLRVTRSGEATADVLTQRAEDYGVERRGQDPSKTKHAQGWLNDRRWLDEPLTSAPVKRVTFV